MVFCSKPVLWFMVAKKTEAGDPPRRPRVRQTAVGSPFECDINPPGQEGRSGPPPRLSSPQTTGLQRKPATQPESTGAGACRQSRLAPSPAAGPMTEPAGRPRTDSDQVAAGRAPQAAATHQISHHRK